jgi:hypothetical protein
VVVLAVTAGLGACSGPAVTRTGAPQTHDVSRIYAAAPEAVRGALLAEFQNSTSPRPAPYTSMSIVELSTWSSTWADSYVDPGGFLDDYRRLRPADRARDLLLQDLTDNYWLSEYTTTSGAVKFHCGLIVHFAPEGTGTRASAFELTPTVWVGEKWAFTAHGIGPGRIHDLRFVEPTVTDRQHVLAWIVTLLSR